MPSPATDILVINYNAIQLIFITRLHKVLLKGCVIRHQRVLMLQDAIRDVIKQFTLGHPLKRVNRHYMYSDRDYP